jgi:hypothetical protein
MCVQQAACPKLGNYLRSAAMLVDLSNNRRGEGAYTMWTQMPFARDR